MMGYTNTEVLVMKVCVDEALKKEQNKQLREGLTMTSDFLEGLIVEGRI